VSYICSLKFFLLAQKVYHDIVEFGDEFFKGGENVTHQKKNNLERARPSQPTPPLAQVVPPNPHLLLPVRLTPSAASPASSPQHAFFPLHNTSPSIDLLHRSENQEKKQKMD